MAILNEYLITFGWALTGAFSMAIALPIMLRIFSKLTPIDEWEEIKKGNIGVSIIVSAVILGAAIVIGFTIMP